MTRVLMISKPMVPPYDDAAKNIVLSQVREGRVFQYRVMGTPSAEPPAAEVEVDRVYADAGAFSPGLRQNLRVMWHGLRPRGADIYHYFFAPNRLTSMAGRVQRRIARVRSVQTVCSQPLSFEGIDRYLFADMSIVLSDDTMEKMSGAGVSRERLRYVRPGIEPIPDQSDDERRAIRRVYGLPESEPVVLFPGDYEFSTAAQTVADAVPLLAKSHPSSTVVFACRIKREASRTIRDRIRTALIRQGFENRVVFLERIENMPAVAGAVDVVVMPAESLYAKMDVPLVLLEAMSQGVPLVLAESPPLGELLACECGLGVSPRDPAALGEAVATILDNRILRERLRAAGRAAVREKYSAGAMARAVERVYEEVMEQ